MSEHQVVPLTKSEYEFVTAVQHAICNSDPTLAQDPSLGDKLIEAYRLAKRMGLTRDQSLADFLYLEIQVPGFSRRPVIREWLDKPGADPGDRFDVLVDVVRRKSSELEDDK